MFVETETKTSADENRAGALAARQLTALPATTLTPARAITLAARMIVAMPAAFTPPARARTPLAGAFMLAAMPVRTRTFTTPLRAALQLTTTLLLTALLLPHSAAAQQSHGAHHDDIDEIVVTASPLAREASRTAITTDVINREHLLDEMGSTLGETLSREPGIATTGFATGASRPVIRGQDAHRVRILENGIGAHDASDVSPDHGVPVNPLAARRVEVLHGPATLRYGGVAVGGVVNVLTERVPRTPAEALLSGEFLLGAEDGTERKDAALLLEGGSGAFAWHIDGVLRDMKNFESAEGEVENSDADGDALAVGGAWVGEKMRFGIAHARFTNEYGIPAGHDAIDLEKDNWKLEWDAIDPLPGFTRLSVRGGLSDYQHTEFEREAHGEDGDDHGEGDDHGDEGDEHDAGEDGDDHDEDEHADEDAHAHGPSYFDDEEYELRMEALHAPLLEGKLEGAFGFHLMRRELEVSLTGAEEEHHDEDEEDEHAGEEDDHDEEDDEHLHEGEGNFLYPTDVRTWALYVFEELALSERLSLELGARYENVEVSGTEITRLFEDDGNFALQELHHEDDHDVQSPGMMPGGSPGMTGMEEEEEARHFEHEMGARTTRSFNPFSVSLGAVYRPSDDFSATLRLASVERAPGPVELFYGGEHHATNTFEVGDPGLGVEAARSAELNFRLRRERFSGKLSLFYTDYSDYISGRFTGYEVLDETGEAGEENGHGHDGEGEAGEDDHDHEPGSGLRELRYVSQDATFYGAELSLGMELLDTSNLHLGMGGQLDVVRGRFANARPGGADDAGELFAGEVETSRNIPRQPPLRYGLNLHFEFKQFPAPMRGNVGIFHHAAQKRVAGGESITRAWTSLDAQLAIPLWTRPERSVELQFSGRNLLDEEGRNHLNYRKDEFMVRGRSMRVELHGSF